MANIDHFRIDLLKPQKLFQSCSKWRDPDEQSKLLMIEPEATVLELSRRGALPSEEPKSTLGRPRLRDATVI
jgi:hypothetical protein